MKKIILKSLIQIRRNKTTRPQKHHQHPNNSTLDKKKLNRNSPKTRLLPQNRIPHNFNQIDALITINTKRLCRFPPRSNQID